jgi:redox-regulated HSP33 family molecular chaperone
MKVLSRLLLAPTVAAALLLACTLTNAARRVSGSAYDGTWSVAIYTLRGDCGSVRVAARIVGGRVYSEDQNYQSNGAVGANGVIRVTVAGAGRSASGSGRLSQNSGAGRWSSSRGECSGTWSAARRAGYY